MAIKNRTVSIVYKILLAGLAGCGLLSSLNASGWEAWRVFDTWLLLLTTVYFTLAALVSFVAALRHRQERNFAPMLEGVIVVNGFGSMLLWTFYHAQAWNWPGNDDYAAFLASVLLPVLTLVDWAAFTRKGKLGWHDPWNWLALPLIFMSVLLLLFGFSYQELPYSFLNFRTNGIENLFWWALLIVVVELILGYVLVLIDHVLSGEIAKHIVMPKIKTIVIEEELPEENEAKTVAETRQPERQAEKTTQPQVSKPHQPAKPKPSRPAVKPVKIVRTSQNRKDIIKIIDKMNEKTPDSHHGHSKPKTSQR